MMVVYVLNMAVKSVEPDVLCNLGCLDDLDISV